MTPAETLHAAERRVYLERNTGTIDALYNARITGKEYNSGDICEHMPLLSELAKGVGHITEFGVRSGNSSLAFLRGLAARADAGTLVGYDIDTQLLPDVHLPPHVTWTVHNQSTIKPEFVIEPTDLLFVDSCHDHPHVLEELLRHSNHVRHLIVMHDVSPQWTGGFGPLRALLDFMESAPVSQRRWRIAEFHNNNNGLAILNRT